MNRRELATGGVGALAAVVAGGPRPALAKTQGGGLTTEDALFIGGFAAVVTIAQLGFDELVEELNDGIENQTERWRMRVMRHLGLWEGLYDYASGFNAPLAFQDPQTLMLEGLSYLASGADDLADVLEDGDLVDDDSAGEAIVEMSEGYDLLTEAFNWIAG